jgi:Zn-dependent M28 family amino/carboxypeptidase
MDPIYLKQSPIGNDLSVQDTQIHLRDHVYILGAEIGERNIWHPGKLAATVEHIKKVWLQQGYEVKTQEYTVRDLPVQNLEIELKGHRYPDKYIVLGAHYDSVRGSPGANDNGSGVAALLELSRLLRSGQPEITIRFVAFVNEEPPFFQTRRMGSRVYAARARQRKENITAMFSLETIGYYSEQPGSQRYPFPLRFFYPEAANFIGFVGNLRWHKLVRQALGSFRRHTHFPAHGVAAPFWLTGIGWSDHLSFWREGFPAIMITDTALFRYDYYHTPADTPDKLVYDKMANVVAGIAMVIADLAGINFVKKVDGYQSM